MSPHRTHSTPLPPRRTLKLTLKLTLLSLLTSLTLTPLLTPPLTLSAFAKPPHGGPRSGDHEEGLLGGAGAGGHKLMRQLKEHLLPIRFVARHMSELKLTEAQRASLKGLMKELQSAQVDSSFQLEAATDALMAALKDAGAPADAVLARADEVMSAERAVKRARLEGALKLRALLTPEQRAQAHAMLDERAERWKERGQRWGKGRKGWREGREGREEGGASEAPEPPPAP